MAPGAMTLLSAGRTPLVVSVIRIDTDRAYQRGTLVTVTTVTRTPHMVAVLPYDMRRSTGPMNQRGIDGYIGVLSAAVEEGQEEVAVSVGGVDMIRFSANDCEISGYPVGMEVQVGDVYRPGFIPLTKPQRCPSTKDQIFSAYIEPSMLTHLKTISKARRQPTTPWTAYDNAANVSERVEEQLQTLRKALPAYPDYIANQEISNSLEGFNKDGTIGAPLWKPNTVGEILMGRDAQDPRGPADHFQADKATLYTSADDGVGLVTLLNDLTDTDGVKPMTVDRWKAHLKAGTMYTVIELPANMPHFGAP